ncbi:hypothetical protein [Streptomyces sp. NPDC094472]|uniref:hypothetical protein n=1 Tax=unclassified Streptomyces TaxID=2593676 RepID=UPI00331EFA1D
MNEHEMFRMGSNEIHGVSDPTVGLNIECLLHLLTAVSSLRQYAVNGHLRAAPGHFNRGFEVGTGLHSGWPFPRRIRDRSTNGLGSVPCRLR